MLLTTKLYISSCLLIAKNSCCFSLDVCLPSPGVKNNLRVFWDNQPSGGEDHMMSRRGTLGLGKDPGLLPGSSVLTSYTMLWNLSYHICKMETIIKMSSDHEEDFKEDLHSKGARIIYLVTLF